MRDFHAIPPPVGDIGTVIKALFINNIYMVNSIILILRCFAPWFFKLFSIDITGTPYPYFKIRNLKFSVRYSLFFIALTMAQIFKPCSDSFRKSKGEISVQLNYIFCRWSRLTVKSGKISLLAIQSNTYFTIIM